MPRLGGESERFLGERECLLTPTSMLLVRIMVGKVADGNRLVEILRNTPIRRGQSGSLRYLQSAFDGSVP